MIKKFLSTYNLLLITIIIIASFLRLYNLSELPPGLYPDEAMNGNNAVEALENRDWKVFYPENHGREGLFINIQSLFIAALGREPWVLRLPSAIFGILTILGLYLFTKELSSNYKVALLSSFLMATSFWHINFSRIGFRAIMAPAFLVWSLYFLLLSYKSYRSYWTYFLSVLGGLIYGLGFYSYIAYRATPLLILFFAFYLYKQHSNNLKIVGVLLLLFVAAAILIVAPLTLYFWNHPTDFLGRTAGISIFNSETPLKDLSFNILKTAGMFNLVGDFNWRHNVAGRPLLFWPVGIMFLIGIAAGFKKWTFDDPILKSQYFGHRMSLVWLLVAGLPVVISNEGLPHALRSLIMAPPVFILSAIGGMKIYEFLKLKLTSRMLHVACYLFLSLLFFESYVTYFIIWGKNPNVKSAFTYNDYVIAQYLNSLPKEVPKYVVLNEKVGGPIERDNPISLQTILFLTDTFTNEKRKEKNKIYLTKEQFQKEKISDELIIKL